MRRIFIAIICSIVLFASSCNWAVWNDPADIPDGTGSTNSGFAFSGKAPSGLFATKARYANAVNLTWDSVNGASYYEIYRAEMDSPDEFVLDSDYERQSIAPIDAAYTDYEVESGKFYSYKVRARSTSNPDIIGAFSDTVRGWVLMSPSSITASQGTSESYIHIKWASVESVRGYRLEWRESANSGDWSVVVPSGSSSDYIFTQQTTEYRFVPTVAQLGKSLYFRVKSVSSSGDESTDPLSAVGYTRVEGAPEAPANLTASQGTSATTITLTWDVSDGDEDYYWEIYKSAEGGSETLICSTYNNDVGPDMSGGHWTYSDSNGLNPGVSYTYSVRAQAMVNGELANGLTSTVEGGCLLSPPPVSNLEIVAESGRSGFQFVVEDAVGAQDNWEYIVYGSNSASGPWYELTRIKALSSEEDRTVFSAYDAASSARRIEVGPNSYQYFTTQTSANGITSLQLHETTINDGERKPVEFTPPQAATGYTVTDNIILSGTSASNGIYPIGIIADEDSLVDYYNVRIWYSQPSSVSQTPDATTTAYPDSYGDGVIALKNVATPGVGTRYWVAIQGVDVLGRAGSWSSYDSGYGAITDEKLILLMQAYCTKPWEYIDTPILTQSPGSAELNQAWKDSQIYKMVSAAGLSSLGSASQRSITGDGGLISYNARMAGIGGAVSFTYSNFGETTFLKVSDGFSMNVDASGTGSASGSLTLTGWYPASIGLTNISVVSQKFVGTYTVTQDGRSSSEVSPDQGNTL